MPGKPLPIVERGGRYFRVYKPEWSDPADISYSKDAGGRWNPPGEFGALYLNQTLRVAAAQARFQHLGRAIGLFDLQPDRRPMLADFDVPACKVVDAVTNEGLRAMRFATSYPVDVPWGPCQRIARRAYNERRAGVAARSNAEATAALVVGEGLAYFDSQPPLQVAARRTFDEWYPDPRP